MSDRPLPALRDLVLGRLAGSALTPAVRDLVVELLPESREGSTGWSGPGGNTVAPRLHYHDGACATHGIFIGPHLTNTHLTGVGVTCAQQGSAVRTAASGSPHGASPLALRWRGELAHRPGEVAQAASRTTADRPA